MMRILEGTTIRVLSKANSGPPGSPSDGDSYIVDSATGAWSTFSVNDIALYITNGWYATTPVEGLRVYVNDEDKMYKYNGSAWAELGESYYLLGMTFDGSPTAAQVVLRHPAAISYQLPASLSGSQFYAAVACTATCTFTLKKNGGSIGTIQFATGATGGTATFSTAQSFSVGDKLTIEAPSPADSTLANLGFTLKGTKT
jgi:hypothetical protein